jgi:TetR/AcrR family transcriptional regulator
MKSAERRSQLLGVAAELFAEKGFYGTTTKEISASAGITEALIFRHFENKDALYAAVIEEYIQNSRRPEWHAGIRVCMASNDDLGLIRALIDYVIEAYRTFPRMQRLMLFAILKGDHKEADRACHLPKKLQREVIDYLTRRQKKGLICNMDPAGVFQIIFSMSRSYAIGKYVYKLSELTMSDKEAVEMFTQFAAKSVLRTRNPKHAE